jgi:DNA-binding transcriptional regulator LsrR (DeoR family)
LSTQVDVTLLGVGTTDPASSGMRRAGYMSEATLEALQQAGAVGDILGYHLDINGHVLDVSINQRVIGATLDSLHRVPTSIVVASGEVKVLPTLATLRGGYADILITDAETASAVLAQHAQTSIPEKPETLATL